MDLRFPPSKSSILDLSEPKKAVELGKEAQPNENAGDQLTQDEIQLITWLDSGSAPRSPNVAGVFF